MMIKFFFSHSFSSQLKNILRIRPLLIIIFTFSICVKIRRRLSSFFFRWLLLLLIRYILMQMKNNSNHNKNVESKFGQALNLVKPFLLGRLRKDAKCGHIFQLCSKWMCHSILSSSCISPPPLSIKTWIYIFVFFVYIYIYKFTSRLFGLMIKYINISFQ